MIDPRLLAQFMRDPQTGQMPMMPGAPGAPGPVGGGAGVPLSPTFEVDEYAQAGVEPPPGYGRAPVTGDEGAFTAPPTMPPPPPQGPGGFLPMGGARPQGGMTPGGPYSGPPPTMQPGPYSGPPPTMSDLPPPRQPAAVSPGVRRAVGNDDVRNVRAIAGAGDPSMMDDEKRQRLIQAILRARGMLG